MRNTTTFLKRADRWVSILGLLIVLVASGCDPAPPPPPQPVGPVGLPMNLSSHMLQTGEMVRIEFLGVLSGGQRIQPHEEQIGEDGTIGPHLVGRVKAAGRTVGELQTELDKLYEPFYRNMTVVVTPANRFYTVSGEVVRSGQITYTGPTTVVKALSAAGWLTDFANRRNVQVTRSNGQVEQVNVNNALRDSKFDIEIFPGDTIHVRRRVI